MKFRRDPRWPPRSTATAGSRARSTRTSSPATARTSLRAVGLDHAQPVRLERPVLPAHGRDLPHLRGAARGHRVGGVRARQRPALRALRDPLRLRAVRRVRCDAQHQGDRAEHGLDVHGMTLACATRTEERAARKLGARRVARRGRRAHGAARRASSCRSASPAASTTGIECGEVLDATRVVDAGRRSRSGRAGRSGSTGARPATILAVRRRRRRPCRAPPPARAHGRRRGRHGVRRARADGPPRRLRAGDLRHARNARSGRSARCSTPTGGCGRCGIVRALARAAPTRAGPSPTSGMRSDAPRGGDRMTRNGHKRVLLAAPRSFCAGVDRAIEIVERLLEDERAAGLRPPRDRPQRQRRPPPRGPGRGLRRPRGRDPARARSASSRRTVSRRPSARTARRRASASSTPSARSSRRCTPRRGATPTSGHLVALDRPRQPRRGDRDEGRAAGADRRRRVARGRRGARHQRPAAGRDHADDAVARRRGLDRRRARRALRRPQAARRGGHLLRDAESAGCREGDRSQGGDAVARDRLADELERQSPRRGGAGARRRGDADRRRVPARSRAARRPPDRRAHRRCLDARRDSSRRCSRRSPAAATRRSKRSPSQERMCTSDCPGRSTRDPVEIPSSVAAALPTLAVFDITNEVSRDVRKAELSSGLAYVTPAIVDFARPCHRAGIGLLLRLRGDALAARADVRPHA